MRVAFAVLSMMLIAAPAAAQPGPPPVNLPGSKMSPVKPLTAQQRAQLVEMTCKIKGNWSLTHTSVGGAVVDKVYASTKGEQRYCVRPDDFARCKTDNPTPGIPCKLLSPLLSVGVCPMTHSGKVTKDKIVSAGLWDVSDVAHTITMDTYTCDRAYKMDTCRYRNEATAVTSFKNAGLVSVDRKITVHMAVCALDDAGEAAYQKKLAKGVLDLNALLQIKKGMWTARCAGHDIGCRVKAMKLIQQAEAEAWDQLQINNDGDGIATMKAITAKYDPIMAKELG